MDAVVDPSPVDRWLAQTHAGPLLELPVNRINVLYLYLLRATAHHVPMFDGISGFEPPLHRALVADPLTDETLALVEQNGVRYVLIRPEWYGGRLPLVSAWLRRNLSRGRLAFVRRFDDGAGGDWLFAVTRVHSNWRSYRVPAQDPMLARMLAGQSTYNGSTFGQLYQPQNGSEIRGPMIISGWALSPFGIREVNALIDNGRVRVKTGLFEREDVSRLFPWYPQTPKPAFATQIDRPPRVPRETNVQIEIIDGRGKRTLLRDVAVTWRR